MTSLDRPGGWVLLKPGLTKPLGVEVEGTTFPAQSGAKRVKLVSKIKKNLVSYAMVAPDTSEDVRREKQSAMFPAIDMVPFNDYELVAGSTVVIGVDENANIADLLVKTIILNDPFTEISLPELSVESSSLHNGDSSPVHFIPQLFELKDAEDILKKYENPRKTSSDSPFMYPDYDNVIDTIRRCCEEKKERYVNRVKACLDALGDSNEGDIEYVRAFLMWTLESTDNYIVCGYREDEDKTFNQLQDNEIAPGDEGDNPISGQIVNARNKKRFDEAMSTPMKFVMRDVARKRGISNTVGSFSDLYDGTTPNVSVREKPLIERFVFVKDLLRCTKRTSFTREIPTKGRGEALVLPPTVITPAYRPLVLHGENELRFKLSLIPNLGGFSFTIKSNARWS